MEKSVQITLIIVSAFFILGILGINTFQNVIPSQMKGPTITATGNSVIQAKPDLITTYFNVVTSSATTAQSSLENKEIFNNIKSRLIEAGFNESDIKTVSFNTYEDFEWNNGYRKSLGYKTINSLKIEVNASNNELASKIIEIVSSENGLISYINFELSQENQNKYKAEALKLAAQDAKSKATAIAQGSGKKVGDLVSISSSDYYYSPWRVYSNEVQDSSYSVAIEASKSIEVQPDSKDISASVTAVYKLK